VDLLQLSDGDVRVDLGGLQAGVAELFLPVADVGAVLQHECGVTEQGARANLGESGTANATTSGDRTRYRVPSRTTFGRCDRRRGHPAPAPPAKTLFAFSAVFAVNSARTHPRAMDFAAQLSQLRLEAEQALDRFVPAAQTRPSRLHSAMRYSLEAGGKRIRPVLVSAAAELFGRRADAGAAAAAIECVHTYSLIHDDLPALDNDDLRRGRPTCHKQFDEPTAILAGDALLTHAFALLASHYADRPTLATALVRELGQAAGSTELIGGQMEDIEAEKSPATRDQVEFIHNGKTAAMIACSLALGGLIGGADEAQLATLRRLGRAVGLAFQVIDDVLDTTATSAALGKTAGKDATAQKATMVRVLALDGARARAAELTAAALAELSKLPGDTAFLRALVESLLHRGN